MTLPTLLTPLLYVWVDFAHSADPIAAPLYVWVVDVARQWIRWLIVKSEREEWTDRLTPIFTLLCDNYATLTSDRESVNWVRSFSCMFDSLHV